MDDLNALKERVKAGNEKLLVNSQASTVIVRLS